MAKEDNLRNIDEYNKTLSQDERTANARQAGLASGKSRNLKARLKEWAEDGGYEKMLAMAEEEIANGNVKMWELIRDTIGEKPSEKIDLSIEDESAREVDEYFARRNNSTSGK